jgi:hypothetical protein
MDGTLVAVTGSLFMPEKNDYKGGVRIVSLQNPEAPALVSETYHPSEQNHSYNGADYVNGYIYVAGGPLGLHLVDAGDVFNPKHLSDYTYESKVWGFDVWEKDRALYVADGKGGLKIIQPNAGFPDFVSSSSYGAPPNGAQHLVVRDNIAYVANYATFVLFDCAELFAPVPVGILSMYAMGVVLQNNYAYVASSVNGLNIVDVSNPGAPVVVGNLPLTVDGTPIGINPASQKVAVSGDRAVVANAVGGYMQVDISDKTSPKLLKHTQTEGACYDVAIMGEWVVAAEVNKTVVTEPLL